MLERELLDFQSHQGGIPQLTETPLMRIEDKRDQGRLQYLVELPRLGLGGSRNFLVFQRNPGIKEGTVEA